MTSLASNHYVNVTSRVSEQAWALLCTVKYRGMTEIIANGRIQTFLDLKYLPFTSARHTYFNGMRMRPMILLYCHSILTGGKIFLVERLSGMGAIYHRTYGIGLVEFIRSFLCDRAWGGIWLTYEMGHNPHVSWSFYEKSFIIAFALNHKRLYFICLREDALSKEDTDSSLGGLLWMLWS